MSKSCLDSQKHIRVMLIGLTAECPLVGNPKDCPLHERRKLPANEQIIWVNSLSDDESLQICHTHCKCFAKKEKGEIMYYGEE